MTKAELSEACARYRAEFGVQVPMTQAEQADDARRSRAKFVERVTGWTADERQLRIDLQELASGLSSTASTIREHLERLEAVEEIRGSTIFGHDSGDYFIAAAHACDELAVLITCESPSIAAIESVPPVK